MTDQLIRWIAKEKQPVTKDSFVVRKPEAERRSEIIDATIREIGATGNLNVTVGQIAKSAGVSSGLAFHYFKDKDTLFLAAMRTILTNYRRDVSILTKGTTTPEARLEAIANASFGLTSFRREAISAWVNFYALALRSPAARRLLYIYQRRLHSNLVYTLRPTCGARAPDVARRIGGLIDGLYLRYALDPQANDGSEGADHILRAARAEQTELNANDAMSVRDEDPNPMDPIAKPQELNDNA
ncbi:transcriptional regulator BetI [Celeribacter halophilus]|uniref:Transcriptional regulator BetI n=1 Tax=Celeribacter halophilus TaxID=576117 RepID=A0AAW7Y1A1_9RHOB|nr:transcriptional regulator BetI [Celeribacter halophilus]MDO6458932.1 transcriptional regulator BetI [Celeribacter halophilus]